MKAPKLAACSLALSALLVAALPATAAPASETIAGNFADAQIGEMQGLMSRGGYADVFGGLAADQSTGVVTAYIAPGVSPSRLGVAKSGLVLGARSKPRGKERLRWQVRFVSGGPSLATLHDVMAKVWTVEPWHTDSLSHLISYGIDPSRHVVAVTLDAITSKLRAESASTFGKLVELRVGSRFKTISNRMLDTQAYFGGDRLVATSGSYVSQCTAGFEAWQPSTGHTGMLTAGHCDLSNTWNQGYYDGSFHISGLMGVATVRRFADNIGILYKGNDRVRALSAYGTSMGLAAAGGQLIGGALIALDPLGLGWRACFLINVPVGVAALALAPRLIPGSPRTSAS